MAAIPIGNRTVEIFHHGVRVAVHVRSPMRHRHSTVPDHMPSAHRRYADWTPARLRREASQIGPATARLAANAMLARDGAVIPEGLDVRRFAPPSVREVHV